MDSTLQIERGRAFFQEEAWLRALEALEQADADQPLGPEDLERLGKSAYMVGRDEEYVAALERAHHAYLAADDPTRATRCGFWVGHSFLFRGERHGA